MENWTSSSLCRGWLEYEEVSFCLPSHPNHHQVGSIRGVEASKLPMKTLLVAFAVVQLHTFPEPSQGQISLAFACAGGQRAQESLSKIPAKERLAFCLAPWSGIIAGICQRR